MDLYVLLLVTFIILIITDTRKRAIIAQKLNFDPIDILLFDHYPTLSRLPSTRKQGIAEKLIYIDILNDS